MAHHVGAHVVAARDNMVPRMRTNASVSAMLVQPLVLALSASPPALEAFFGATDLTPEILANPDARVSPAQFCVAWSEGVRLSGAPHVALELAAAIPSGAFGLVEYVCRSAATLGDALTQWVRYLNLLNDAVKVGLVEEGDRGCVRVLAESEAPAPASHELCFALLATRARELTPTQVRIVAADFTHRVRDATVYERWFGAPVRFGAPFTQLVFARSALAVPLVTADANLLTLLGRVADDLCAKTSSDPPLTAQVRAVLGAALRSNDAQIEGVAQRLGLTARSLQRRLKDEGSSFQSMREEVRQQLAQRYLDDDLAITEISFLLGFSEPSAFFRAFKRWTGLTPVESRALRRATVGS
jgi:AraC-like DNA-binding protein